MTNNESDDELRTTTHIKHIDAISSTDINSATAPNDVPGVDVTISHPVEDKDELRKSFFQQACLRAANIDPDDRDLHRTGTPTAEIDTRFDTRVLDDAPNALDDAGLNLGSNDLPIDDGYMLALYLKRVRHCSYDDLADHLDDNQLILDRLELDGGVSREAFRRRAKELSDPDALDEAMVEGFFSAYRAGTPIPQSVLDNIHGSDSPVSIIADTDLDELATGEIPPDIRDEAIKNWAALFVDRCLLGHLEFDRDDSTQYPIESFYGLLAHAAVQSRSLDDATNSCARWVVDRDLVPSQGAILNRVKERSVTELSEQFFAANKEFLDIAAEYSVFADPLNAAFDPTDDPWYGEDSDESWMKGYAKPLKGIPESADADEKWRFGVLGLTQPNVQFILGIYPIGKDVDKASSLARVLRPTVTDTPVDIHRLIMDRGLTGADLINQCRYHLGDEWVILGKREYELADLLEDTPDGESKFKHLETYPGGVSEKPNAVVLPVDDIEDEEKSHRVFLTDLSEDEIDKETLTKKYRKRRRIETKIRQLKIDFDIPLADNATTEVKYFYRNLAMLFVNFHNLVNNSLSPEYSLPIGEKNYVTDGDLLSAIREVAFERAKNSQ